jgi:hypothetical protein
VAALLRQWQQKHQQLSARLLMPQRPRLLQRLRQKKRNNSVTGTAMKDPPWRVFFLAQLPRSRPLTHETSA